MKIIIKQTFFLPLLIIAFYIISFTSLAADSEVSTYTTYNNSEIESTFSIYPRLRGTYFMEGEGSIGQLSSGYVIYSASTTASSEVPYVSVSVSLQKFDGGIWYTLETCNDIEYNDYYVSISRIAYVGTSGAYYRIYTYHNANGETASAYSKSIWID